MEAIKGLHHVIEMALAARWIELGFISFLARLTPWASHVPILILTLNTP